MQEVPLAERHLVRANALIAEKMATGMPYYFISSSLELLSDPSRARDCPDEGGRLVALFLGRCLEMNGWGSLL
jgi:hypothetical protein